MKALRPTLLRLGGALAFLAGFVWLGSAVAPAPVAAAPWFPPLQLEIFGQGVGPDTGASVPGQFLSISLPTNSTNFNGCISFDGSVPCGSGPRLLDDGTLFKFKYGVSSWLTIAHSGGTIVAGSTTSGFQSNAAAGNVAFQAMTDGAKTCFGATTVAACATASGATVTFAGSINTPSITTTSSAIISNATLTLSHSSGNVYFSSSAATAGRLYGHMSAANATASNPALVATTDQALDATDAVFGVKAVNEGANLFLVDYSGNTTTNTVRLPLGTLATCAAGIEGQLATDVLSGVATGKRTKLCLCTSDGASAYKWQNVATATLGTTTTCGTE